jgi:hypothetical protein
MKTLKELRSSGSVIVSVLMLAITFPAVAISIGDRIECTTSGLNIRPTASTNGNALGQANTGDLGVVGGGPYSGSGYTWYYITWDAHPAGYSISTYLQSVDPSAPTQISPGNTSSPGPTISTLTPVLSWNAATGATGYGVYVENVATGLLVYNNDAVGNVTSLTLPSGTLQAGMSYVWNMRASDSAGYIYCTTLYYFQTQASPPSISSVSPNPVTGANSGETFTVYGSGFVSGAQVKLSWPAVGVASSGNTTLSATLGSNSLQVSGAVFGNDPSTWSAQVINPGNVTSSPYNFNVQAPVPAIQSLSQYSATAGGSDFILTVYGATFDQNSVVWWNGVNLTTTSVTSSGGITTALNAQVPAGDIASTGTATITVYTPSPGGGTSSGARFTINGVTPAISSVSPNPAIGANTARTLTVYGSGFVSGAQVKLAYPAVGVLPAGSATLTAIFVSTSELQISPTYGNDPGTWTAQVINPGNVTSSAYSFAVQAPFPVITSVSPSSATAGGSAFTLTVNGATFDQSSVVRWNGTNLATTPTVSLSLYETTALTAQVPASAISSAGTDQVTVYTPGPGGGTSAAATFTSGTQNVNLGADFNAQSIYNSDKPNIDWQQEISGSLSFLIVKGAQGNNPNSFLPSNMSDAPAVTSGFTFGVYDYADPDEFENPSSMVSDPSDSAAVIGDAQAAANAYYQIAEPYLTTGHLLPALDVEDEEGSGGFNSPNASLSAYPQWTWAEIAEWIAAWTTQLQQDDPTLNAPILYMTEAYAGKISPQLIDSYLPSPISFPLWIVDINNSPNIDSAPSIGSWPTWVIEQYDQNGPTPPGDLDALNSSTALSSLEIGATTYTVTPSVGANGSISPNTAQTVNSGGSVTFTAAPASGYMVNQWLVNGTSVQTGGTSFTLNNVVAASSVEVTFTTATATMYTVTPSAGPNGSISPNTSQTVNSGSSVSFTAAPANGYVVNQWLVNATAAQSGGTSFTLNNVLAAASVEVTFTTSAQGTNVVFSDNFSGSSIDATKWTTSGDTVIQTNQIMEVLTTVTDQPGALTSQPFAIANTGLITITRQVFLHHDDSIYYLGNNHFFTGVFSINVSNLPTFSAQYCDYDYSGNGLQPTYGFFIDRNGANATSISNQSDVSPGITAIWDTWFNEKITYDPGSGQLQYYTNDTLAIAFNVGPLPIGTLPEMSLYFQAYGWWTGHEQLISNLVVTQNGPAPQTGSLQVTITPVAAITSGAQWQVDGGTWQTSGATVSDLSAGCHSIGFNAITGWNTPANQTVSITAGSISSAIGTYMAMTTSNVIFSDNFTGSSIDPTKWTTSGNTVIQTNETMEVLTTVTDGGGSLTSLPFAINPTGKITITRQAFLQYGNDYFIGALLIGVDSLPWFGVDYANMDYSDGVTYMPCHGFFLMRNGTRADIIQSQTDISAAITPLWDTWFNEEVTYDPTTGIMEYFTNDVSALTFNVGTPPATNAPTMTLSFNAWGWYTGHEQLFQNLVVSQAQAVSPPPQLTGVGLSTNGMFLFNLNGPRGSNYVIQSSSDLINWVNQVTNVVPSGGTLGCAFPVQSNRPQMYYRALPLP